MIKVAVYNSIHELLLIATLKADYLLYLGEKVYRDNEGQYAMQWKDYKTFVDENLEIQNDKI
jgi:hypothetical protein